MNRFSLKAVVTAFAAATLAACTDAPVQPRTDADAALRPSLARGQVGAEQVVPGDVVVRLKAGVDASAIAREHGLAVKAQGPKNAFTVLAGAAGSERALAARLGGDARVVYAQPNYIRQPSLIRPELWAFRNDGTLRVTFCCGDSRAGNVVNSLIPVADADEDNVEGYAAAGSAVVIGSIDSGVDLDHPEFVTNGVSRLIPGQNWVKGGPVLPEDVDGHGTHTTGTMAGNTVGVAGVSGAAPNVQVYVQRVCGNIGCFTTDIVSAIYAAADYPGMVAMNISIGGTSHSQIEQDAISYAVDTKKVLVIVSAGNGGTGTVSCPACDEKAISVAATDWRDEHAYYTNWGPGLDISAPGGELYTNTTDQGGIYSAFLDGGYAYLQGTSMAAPQVTGTAAIVASMTGLRGAALRDRILSTTDDLGARGYDTDFGSGRLNSYRAVVGKTLRER